MTKGQREFDVVLWGASSFVGRVVAEYLVKAYVGSGVRIALAGRDQKRVEDVREALKEVSPAAGDLPILLADSLDRASLRAMAARTKVVCATVGPFTEYGSDLVAACVETGTDYCDLAGESAWLRKMIDMHDEAARAAGARIVHCCGFDSVPSDIGTFMLQEHALRRFGAPCSQVKFFLAEARGGFSGGTFASLAIIFEGAANDPEARSAVHDPYSLNPPGERSGPDGPTQMDARYESEIKAWTAPFVMAHINEKIVRRSNALMGFRYGRDFRYAESMQLPFGAAAKIFTKLLNGYVSAMGDKTSSMRSIINALLPGRGKGPSRKSIEKGYFIADLHGWGTSRSGAPFKLRGKLKGDRDPGYGATAIMLGESAVCLALDETPGCLPAGSLTPSTALGTTLLERLRRAGLTFEVTEESAEAPGAGADGAGAPQAQSEHAAE